MSRAEPDFEARSSAEGPRGAGGDASAEEFNLERFEGDLRKIEHSLREIHGRSATIVIGLTGHGKSTLINYLQARPLEKVVIGRGMRRRACYRVDKSADTNTDPSPAIGEGAKSETDFPAHYKIVARRDILDSAGFFDNRGNYHRLLSRLGLNIACQTISEAKAVIIVISAKLLEDARATDFFEVAKILEAFFRRHTHYDRSVKFVFSGVPAGVTVENILEGIEDIRRDLRPDKYHRHRKMNDLLSIMNRRNVVVGNLDTPDLREELTRFMITSPAIPKDDLHFSVNRVGYVEYMTVISKIASVFFEAYSKKSNAELEIARLDEQMAIVSARIENLERQIAEHESTGFVPGASIASLQERIAALREQLTAIRQQISEHERRIPELSGTIGHVREDRSPQRVHSESYSEMSTHGTVAIGTRHSHVFEYETDRPILPPETKGVDWSKMPADRHPGRTYAGHVSVGDTFELISQTEKACKYRYTAPSHVYGEAEFTVSIEKRHTQGAREQVTRYEREVAEHREVLVRLGEDAARVERQITELSEQLVSATADERSRFDTTLERLRGELRSDRALYSRLSGEKDTAEQELADANATLEENDPRFKMVQRLDRVSNFSEDAVQEFLRVYGSPPRGQEQRFEDAAAGAADAGSSARGAGSGVFGRAGGGGGSGGGGSSAADAVSTDAVTLGM